MALRESSILGTRVNLLSKHEVVQFAIERIKQGNKTLIFTPYSEFFVHANKNQEFSRILNRSDLNIPDGFGVVWAEHFLRKTYHKIWFLRYIYFLPSFLLVFFDRKRIEKVSGVDFSETFAGVCAEKGFKVFLLGASEKNNKDAISRIEKAYPSIKIKGFSGSSKDDKFTEIQRQVNEFSPDFLLVGFSPPVQEGWIMKHSDYLDFRVVIGAGGTIDYMSGNKKRAPEIMQNMGMEWLHRLIKDFSRISRIFNAVVVFPIIVLLGK
jgi:N-acetylglucosaminyldiphosphoundecaprenol N-acetyl-beta-D-mannosaminyltransferase